MKKIQMFCRWAGILAVVLLGACGGGGDGSSSPGTIQIETTLYDAREGSFVNIRISRIGGSNGNASVDYTTVDGTAVGGTDYTAASGTLTWPNGVSGNLTVSIPIPNDSTAEFTKSFSLTLSNASGATLGSQSTATVNIIDNDAAAVSAVGAITALGSATVNGVRYDTRATTVTINGQSAQLTNLQPGQVVVINGDVNFSNVTGTAAEIDYSAMVIGPVEIIEAAQQHLVVMGQSVYTNSNTVFDPSIDPGTFTGLAIDDTVEISGFRNAAGEIIATRIAPDTTSTNVQLIGTVSGPIVNNMFSLHGLTVDYGSATENNLPGGTPVIGQLVIVRGSLAGGVLVASEISVFSNASTTVGERVLLSGLITQFTSSADFDLNSVAIMTDANTDFFDGTAGDLATDVEIIIDGEVISGGDTVLAHGIYFNGLPNDRTVLTFDFDNFTNIAAAGFLTLTVTQGENYSIEVMVNSSQASDVQVTQTGDTLFIDETGSFPLILDVFVTMPVLNRIDVDTGPLGNVTLRDFNQAQMIVNMDGIGLLRGEALTIGDLTAMVSGVCIMDFGDISPIGNANIAISSVSQATLNMDVGATITGSVTTGQGTGHSILYYYGTSVTVNVTTDILSEVIKLGETKP